MNNQWKESLAITKEARKVEKLTNEEYDELSQKADEKIRKNNMVSSEEQEQIKLTKFSEELKGR